ncbi:hypothetical protein [Sphingomonas sp. 8AM]|uniref:hypothetical protein n=1 Tax=Sphingomonas sp. 8AM TaxID=2653170 RepID=UPI0012F12643|nr:hypothetical protein [Sphingomonas sp. 8AM]VXC55426.1 conserved membrane hypothetical protein [Sphingomonas sp. 8AM]
MGDQSPLDRAQADAGERRRSQSALDERVCRLICPMAAAMVGVCLTGIGLLHVGIVWGKRASFADDLLAVDSLIFLIAMLASYLAVRTPDARRRAWLHRLEQVADASFILAMLLLTAACFVITYAVSA